jgi:hypothetical protein
MTSHELDELGPIEERQAEEEALVEEREAERRPDDSADEDLPQIPPD